MKAYILHYYEDDKEYKLYGTNESVLLNKIKEWESDDLSTSFDHISELHYTTVQDLFNYINSTQ